MSQKMYSSKATVGRVEVCLEPHCPHVAWKVIPFQRLPVVYLTSWKTQTPSEVIQNFKIVRQKFLQLVIL